MGIKFSTIKTVGNQPVVKTFGIYKKTGKLGSKSAANLYEGTIKQREIETLEELKTKVIDPLKQSDKHDLALALGICTAKESQLTTKANLTKSKREQGFVTRSKEFFEMPRRGLLLLDIDNPKKFKIETEEELAIAFQKIPALKGLSFVITRSNSHNITEKSTGKILKTGGFHAYIEYNQLVRQHTLKDFKNQLELEMWENGLGGLKVSRVGSLLNDLLIDLACFSPERLIFEAPPVLTESLTQEYNPALFVRGKTLDMTDFSTQLASKKIKIQKLKKLESQSPEIRKEVDVAKTEAKKNFISRLKNKGTSTESAMQSFDSLVDNNRILSNVILISAKTKAEILVSDVLKDPDNYDEKVICDPVEPCYNNYASVGIIKVSQRTGKPYISSFAHGGRTFDLYFNTEDLLTAINAVPEGTNISAGRKLLRCWELVDEEMQQVKMAVKDVFKKNMTNAGIKMLVRCDKSEEIQVPPQFLGAKIALNLAAKFEDMIKIVDGNVRIFASQGVFKGTWIPLNTVEIHRIVQNEVNVWTNGLFTEKMVRDVTNIYMREIKKVENTENHMQSKDYVAFNNGVYSIKSSSFCTQFDRSLYLTWKLPYDYQEGEECPRFKKLLSDLTREPEILRAALRGIITSASDLQFYIEAYGGTSAGKTSLTKIITLLMGKQNTAIGDMEILANDKFETFSLITKKFVLFPDAEDTFMKKSAKFKQLVGGDPMRVERKFSQMDSEKSKPFRGVAMVIANEPLRWSDSSGAIERRRRTIICEKRWKGKPIANYAESIFEDESSQIFNYIMNMDDEVMRHHIQRKDDYQSIKHNQVSIPTYNFYDKNYKLGSKEDSLYLGGGVASFDTSGEVSLFEICRDYMGEEGHTNQTYLNFMYFRKRSEQTLRMLFGDKAYIEEKREGKIKVYYVKGLVKKDDNDVEGIL